VSAQVAGKTIEIARYSFQGTEARGVGEVGRDPGQRRQSFSQDLPRRLPVRQHEEGGSDDLEGRARGSPWEVRSNRE